MAHAMDSKRLKRLLEWADKVLWGMLFGLAAPTAIVEALVNGSIAYGYFTALKSPLHGLAYCFVAVSGCTTWPIAFFMIWKLVS